MGTPATFETFQAELGRLIETFGRNFGDYQKPGYNEADLRNEFLNPFFVALGWDVSNRAGLAPHAREVRVESRGEGSARQRRADYEFRMDRQEKFICEAKRPYEELSARYVFQAKNYAWNRGLPLAVLTDFEEIKLYIVGGRPDLEKPEHGEYRVWRFTEYPQAAQEIWGLLARPSVAGGSIEKLVESLPKRPLKGKARQQWLIKPDRTRAVDVEFLRYLDEQRRELASDIYRHNPQSTVASGDQLNEAVQRIMDRILFLRICEDRDIDTGRPLARILDDWLENQPDSPLRPKPQPLPNLVRDDDEAARRYGAKPPTAPLYHALVRHFRALDRRPPSHIPYFNGQLFKPHFSEDLEVSDEFLANLIRDLSADDSNYLFSSLPVEILGSVYERFIGKIVRPKGVGITVDEKPEVRKAGGVYYTPRYIVNYIVEQTVGELLKGKSPKEIERLRILDPACGSGSFLIRAYERVMEHYVEWFLAHPAEQRPRLCYRDASGDLRLTTTLKHQILTNNIYGVDLDGQAIEVTQLSLYLRMLQGETRRTMNAQREFQGDKPILPPLERNIQRGNSLIASDFSLIPDEVIPLHAFDWDIQFKDILAGGGFDAVIGNPPYVRPHKITPAEKRYFWKHYRTFTHKSDLYCCFIERATQLLRKGGLFGYIVSHGWLRLNSFQELRKLFLREYRVRELVELPEKVFKDAQVATGIVVAEKNAADQGKISVMEGQLTETGPVFTLQRRIPQAIFRATFQNVFDLSISPETERVKEKMRQGPTIGSLYRVCFGLKTGDDTKFLHRTRGLHPDDKRLLRGEDVKRYDSQWKGEYVWYVPDRMRAHRPTARPGEAARFEQPKVLVKDTTADFAGTYDAKRFYVKDVLIVIPQEGQPAAFDLRFVAGLINSAALRFYYRSTFKTIHVQCEELSSLPLPPLDLKKPNDKAAHDEIVMLVDKMLAFVPRLRTAKTDHERRTLQNAVDATDLGINRVIYGLYGLTRDEIKTIEESVAP